MVFLSDKHERILNLLKQGITIIGIAESLGINVGSLRNYCRKQKLHRYKSVKEDLLTISQDINFQYDYKDTSMAVSYIAEKYKLDTLQVYYCAKIAGIKRPKKSKKIIHGYQQKISLSGHTGCQFIHGDGKNAHFCTNKTQTHLPFCEEHAKICYVAVKKRLKK